MLQQRSTLPSQRPIFHLKAKYDGKRAKMVSKCKIAYKKEILERRLLELMDIVVVVVVIGSVVTLIEFYNIPFIPSYPQSYSLLDFIHLASNSLKSATFLALFWICASLLFIYYMYYNNNKKSSKLWVILTYLRTNSKIAGKVKCL